MKPLRAPADFKGLRLRVQASRVLVAQMRALGAEPVVLPFGETRRALARRVVDGAENPLSNFLTQGLQAVQTDLTLTRHGYLGYCVVVNQRFWNHLRPGDRAQLALRWDDAKQKLYFTCTVDDAPCSSGRIPHQDGHDATT